MKVGWIDRWVDRWVQTNKHRVNKMRCMVNKLPSYILSQFEILKSLPTVFGLDIKDSNTISLHINAIDYG